MRGNQRKAGVILSYISEAIKILSSLLYTPIMLRLLGQSEYGVYQLVYSVVSYLGLLSLGFGSAYVRYYSRYNENGQQKDVARLNGLFIIIFSAISVICILCGIVMVENVEGIFGTGLTEKELNTTRILMTFMVINLALTFLGTVFDCSIGAHERFVFQKLLIVCKNILTPFLTLPLLMLGFGSVGMVCVTTGVTLLSLVINVWYCFSKLKISFCFRGLQPSLFKEMWVFTFFIFLGQIVDQINWSVDNFLLGRMSGTVAVAVYGVGAQINTMYRHFSSSVSNVFVPKVNQIVAKSDNDTALTSLFVRVGRVQFSILALILSGFIFFGKQFIFYWAGAGYSEAYFVAIWLLIPHTIPLIQNLGIDIQRAKNMHKTRTVVYFFISIVNIFISILLIRRLGPVGAAIGTAISIFAGNGLFMNWYYHFRVGLDIVRFWKEIGKFIPALIAPCIAGVCIVVFVEFSSLFSLFLCIFLYSIVYCAAMWLAGLNDSEKNMVTQLAKGFRKRLKRR